MYKIVHFQHQNKRTDMKMQKTIVMPKITRTELKELQHLHETKNKKENYKNYQLVAKGLNLPPTKDFILYDDAVRMHLSVQRTRIVLGEKKLKQGSKIIFQGRVATITKVKDFDEKVTLYPFGGYAVIITFPDGTAKKCGGTQVEAFIKAK